jgi:EmrB/QacA subfamily drug resistance transporter
MERKWRALLIVCVAIFMLLLDITIVNVALPSIQRDLHTSFTDLQWVVDAYALTLSSVLLVSGSIADLLGRRLVFLIGLVIFSGASLTCGLAGSPLMLTLSRGVQGFGGAMLFATSLALLAGAFHGRDRGTAFGVWGATTGIAVAVGPLAGGALTDTLGWQSIFLINVPIGIGAFAMTFAKVNESRDPNPVGIDFPGAIAFSGSLFMLVLALIRGNDDGWGSAEIVGLLAGSAVAMIAFLAIEARSSHPMFDLKLFRKPAFAGASIVAFTLSASMFAMFLYLVLYFQDVDKFSPFGTGLRFATFSAATFIVAPIAGKLSARFPVRWFLGGGLALVGFGLLLMHGLSHGLTVTSPWTALLAGLIVAGVGTGLINPPLASTAIGVVPQQRAGMGSGIITTFRQVGIATGIAGLGAIFQSQVLDKVRAGLAGTPGEAHSSQIAHAVTSGATSKAVAATPPQFRNHVEAVAHSAFVNGLNELLIVGTIIAFVGAALALLLVRQRDFVPSQAPGQAEAEPVAAAA